MGVRFVRMLDAIQIARRRFNRDSWRGYHGNGWRPDRAGWRKLIRNVKWLLEKREYEL